MMQAIRGKAGSIVIKIMFGMLIVSFALWGIYTRTEHSSSPETVIATVGERSIRMDEVQRELQPIMERLRVQFGGSVDPQQLKQLGVVDSVLESLLQHHDNGVQPGSEREAEAPY